MPPELSNRYPALLIALTLLVAFMFQGTRGLYETTEGRYAECAREMVETGNWIVPQLDYRPHWSKPPLVYWCIALSIKTFGNNEFAVRFPNAVVFVLLVFIVWKLGSLIRDDETGLVSAFIFSTSLFPLVAVNSASTDLTLSFWEALSVLLYWWAYRCEDDGERKRLIMFMWISFGFAFLTKGPPGLLALLPILVFHFRSKMKRKGLTINSLPGIVLFVLIGLSWYILVAIEYRGLFSYFLHDEVYSRIFTDKFNRNPQWFAPIVLYILPVSLGTLPWAVYWRKVLKSRNFPFDRKSFKAIMADPGAFFLILWLGLPLIVLSLARSRLLLYIFPFFPASVLLLGRGITGVLGGANFLRRAKGMAIVTAFVLILVKLVSAYVPVSNDMKPLYRLCLAEDTGSVHYVVFRMRDLYGLQFYLERDLERVSVGNADWADRDINALLGEITDSPRFDKYVLIAKSGDDSLKELLDAYSLEYSVQTDSRYYHLYIILACRL